MNFLFLLLLILIHNEYFIEAEEAVVEIKSFRTFFEWIKYNWLIPFRHVGLQVELLDGQRSIIENYGAGTVVSEDRKMEGFWAGYDSGWIVADNIYTLNELKEIGGTEFNLITNNSYHARKRMIKALKWEIDFTYANLPVHEAAYMNMTDILKSLLDHGSSPNSFDSIHWTPLHYAAYANNLKAAEILMTNGANINSVSDQGDTPLNRAVKFGFFVMCKLLLDNGAKPNAKDLIWASEYDYPKIMTLLLNNGADANELDEFENTALNMASQYGKEQIIKILLEAGANVNMQAKYAHVPFVFWIIVYQQYDILKMLLDKGLDLSNRSKHVPYKNVLDYAARNMNEGRIVEILLKNGADVNAKNEYELNRTALHYAAMGNKTNNTILLIEAKANIDAVDSNGWTPFAYAIWKGSLDVAKILFQNGANIKAVNILNDTILHFAASFDNLASINFLLQKGGIDVNAVNVYNSTPLHTLIGKDRGLNRFDFETIILEGTKLLLKYNASIEAKTVNEWTPCQYAAHYGYYHVVKLLLENNANPNTKAKYYLDLTATTIYLTPLFSAIYNNSTEMVQLLLSKGALVDVRDSVEMTPLHWASKIGSFEIFTILTEHGANLWALSKFNADELYPSYTALHWAALGNGNCTKIAKFLIQNGADINRQQIHGFTPLHYAAKKNKIQLLHFLLDNGASLSITTNYANHSFTALHFSASNGHLEIANILLQHGSDPNAIDKFNGQTSMHLAAKNKHFELFMLLLKYKGNKDIEDSDGNTPLHYALESWEQKIERSLWKYENETSKNSCNAFIETRCEQREQCIPNAWACDGQKDCVGGDDEEEKKCQRKKCLEGNYFQCGFECISNEWICDGKIDCANQEDEKNCLSIFGCQEDHFRCQNGRCLALDWVCDGFEDCEDGSDERDCSPNLLLKNEICDKNDPNCECEENDKTKCSNCKFGFSYSNGKCQETKNCTDEFGICEQICLNGKKGRPKCACQIGYKLVGQIDSLGRRRECRALGPHPLLLASTESEIRQLNLITNAFYPLQNIHSEGFKFDYWYGQMKLFEYSDYGYTHKKLVICPLDLTKNGQYSTFPLIIGNECEMRILEGYSSAKSIALDWVHGLLFTMDGKNKGINVIELSSNRQVNILSMNMEKTGHLTIDPEMRLIFWTMYDAGRIERAGMDGRDRMVLTTGSAVSFPWAITTDLTTRRLYWTDDDLNQINSCDYWGQNLRPIIHSKMFLMKPVSIGVFESNVFWSDEVKGIFKADKFHGTNVTKLSSKLPFYSIRIFQKQAQPEFENVCKNHKCGEICLPRAKIWKSSEEAEEYSLSNQRPLYSCVCEESFNCNHQSDILNTFLVILFFIVFLIVIASFGVLYRTYKF